MRLASFNVRGLPKTRKSLALRPDIVDVLECADIVCVQETWYSKQELGHLNSLHEEFYGFGCATVDFRDGVCTGHPSGGVTILFRKSMATFAKPIDLELDWCCALEISLPSKRLIVFNVYMPFQCRENTEKYAEQLGVLESIIGDL